MYNSRFVTEKGIVRFDKSETCQCGYPLPDLSHIFLNCQKFNADRQILLNSIQTKFLSLESFLRCLCENDSKDIKIVVRFIKNICNKLN